MVKREGAAQRRTRELKVLAAKGVLVYFEYPGKARVGALHIWPSSGRWFDETTGRSGRLHQMTVRELIERVQQVDLREPQLSRSTHAAVSF
jgi:hypothetical protein